MQFKKSRYTYILEIDDRKVAFNSMSCALAEIDDDFERIYGNIEEIKVEDLDDNEVDLVNDMLRGWYIVSTSVNELEQIKFRNYSGKYAKDYLSLVIAPTMDCNFGCPYCFEHPKPGFISREVQDRLVEMVRDDAERKRAIDITWYGGEPLLAKDVVFDLSRRFIEICDQNDVNYNACMITNGYLLTDEDIEQLRQCRIASLQITIDGTEKIHNSRRFEKDNPAEGTFTKIIENVQKLYAEGFGVSIRTNIDRTNIDDTKNLILYLKDLEIPDALITFGHVSSSTEFNQDIKDTCLTMTEYSDANLDLQEFLHNEGFDGAEFPHYPGIKRNYCGADSINTFVIDPEGYMYKCWNEVGNIKDSVGNIMWDESDYTAEMVSRNIAYMTWSPFEKESCRECKVLPICMGGCPYIGIERGHKQCERWKFGLLDTLMKMYKQRMGSDV